MSIDWAVCAGGPASGLYIIQRRTGLDECQILGTNHIGFFGWRDHMRLPGLYDFVVEFEATPKAVTAVIANRAIFGV